MNDYVVDVAIFGEKENFKDSIFELFDNKYRVFFYKKIDDINEVRLKK